MLIISSTRWLFVHIIPLLHKNHKVYFVWHECSCTLSFLFILSKMFFHPFIVVSVYPLVSYRKDTLQSLTHTHTHTHTHACTKYGRVEKGNCHQALQLKLIPGTHIVDRENWFLLSCPLTSHTYSAVCTLPINNKCWCLHMFAYSLSSDIFKGKFITWWELAIANLLMLSLAVL